MVVQADQFGQTSATFPQLVGTATLIGSTALLVRDYLPEPLHTVVTGSTSITGGQQGEEMQEKKAKEEQDEQAKETVVSDRPLSPSLFTGILVTAYIGLSYLFSMFLMTPLFVIAYLVWFKRPWYTIVVVTVIAIALAYAFATVLIVPVDEGMLIDDFLFIGLPGVL